MADIFISYSRLDLERVKPLADRFASLGYSLWWDQQPGARQASFDERERELDAARAVLVVWSLNGRNAIRVSAEAAHALETGKLLQLKLDPAAPPAPFDALDAADMTGAGEWGPLEHAVAQLVRHGERAPTARSELGAMPTLAAAGSPTLITIAIGAALAAYAGAVSASFNGVMTLGQLQIALVGIGGVASAGAALCAFRLFSTARADG